MDAQVAYGFHHLRDEKPYLAQGPISNKVMAKSPFCLSMLDAFSFDFMFVLIVQSQKAVLDLVATDSTLINELKLS